MNGGYSDLTVWAVIVILGIGTFLIRFSFLGVVGNRPIPDWAQRALRYTAVSVLPALVAPLVMWPAANDGRPDPVRLVAAAVTVGVGLATRRMFVAIIAGAVTLAAGVWLSSAV